MIFITIFFDFQNLNRQRKDQGFPKLVKESVSNDLNTSSQNLSIVAS